MNLPFLESATSTEPHSMSPTLICGLMTFHLGGGGGIAVPPYVFFSVIHTAPFLIYSSLFFEVNTLYLIVPATKEYQISFLKCCTISIRPLSKINAPDRDAGCVFSSCG